MGKYDFLKIGSRILLRTRCQILEGTFHLRLGTERFVVTDVKDILSETIFKGEQYFAFSEIIYLKEISANNEIPPTECNSQSELSDKYLFVKDVDQIAQQAKEKMLLIDCAKTEAYHMALLDIASQQYVTLFSTNCHKTDAIRTLVIGTSEHIYIFQLITIPRTLKRLLNAHRPYKIIYDTQMSHEFKGTYNLYKAVTSVRKAQSQSLSLIEAIVDILRVPRETLTCSAEPINSSNDRLVFLAKVSAFQLELFEHINHDHRLRNLYEESAAFARTFSDMDNLSDVAQAMDKNSDVGKERIVCNQNWN